ncbi:MAG: TolC family protein [Paludibacteraceae bacterium]
MDKIITKLRFTMNKKWILLALVCLAGRSFAQIQFNSLQEVLNYADGHSFTIQASVAQQAIEQSGKRQAQSSLYPTLNIVTGFTDNITLLPTLVPAKLFNPTASDNEYSEMTFGKKYIYNAGLVAQWDILNFQKIFAIQTANLKTNAGKLNTQKVKYETYNKLASVYYSILLINKSLSIYNENVKVTDSLRKNAQEKYQKGIISEEDMNKVLIRHLQNKKNLEYAQTNLQQLHCQFQMLLNTKKTLLVSGEIDEPLVLNTQINTTHPDVLWQQSQVKISESVVKQNKSLHTPSLSMQYQYNYNWATNEITNLSGANKLPSQYLGVKLSLPIFNGFLTESKIRESKTQLKIQQMQLENITLNQQKEDETLELQYKQTGNTLEKNKEILELQQKNDAHTENKYEIGIIGLDERMTKYNDLLTAQYNYLQSLADFSLAQYQIYIRQINF